MQENAKNSTRRLLALLGVTFLIFAVPQLVLKPRPATHPLFPFLTLNDRTLPFFNVAGFHDTVFSWYAFDDHLARAWAEGNHAPLGETTPSQFQSWIIERASKVPQAHALSEMAATEDAFEIPLSVNHLGFRGPSPESGKGKKRIVAVGDSLTFGFGMPDGAPWVDQMRKELEPLNAEVLNAGVISFDSVLGKELLRSKVLPLHPDIVLLGFGFNDYNFNNRSALPDKNVFAPDYWNKVLAKRRSLAGQFTWALNNIRLVQLAQLPLEQMGRRRQALAMARAPYEQRLKYLATVRGQHSTSRKEYAENFQAMLSTLRENRIRAVLLQSNITSRYYEDILEALGREFDVPLLNFRKSLLASLGKEDLESSEGEPNVLFRVEIPAAWRARAPQVYVMPDYFSAVETGAALLNDTGENGDRVAEDGIYSGAVPVAWGTILSFRFMTHLQEPEQWIEEFGGWRIYRRFDVTGDLRISEDFSGDAAAVASLDAPIYRFDDLSDDSNADFTLKPLMLEICHPNARGHAVLGQTISQTVRGLL